MTTFKRSTCVTSTRLSSNGGNEWRGGILFAENKLRWKNPVHEFIDGIDSQKVKYFDTISILHDTPPDRHALKKDRNISLLRKHYASGATDDRSLYIYAVECLHSLLKDEGEQILDRFFSQVKICEYRYEILSKMYNFFIHFGEPQRAVEALGRAIAEDPSRAEAYYKLGRHLSDKADRPADAIPLLTVASMIRIPGHGTPEAEAYGYGPRDSLCRAHFRLENIDAARRLAAKALERKPPRTANGWRNWRVGRKRRRRSNLCRRNGGNGPRATSGKACRAGRSFASSKKTASVQGKSSKVCGPLTGRRSPVRLDRDE